MSTETVSSPATQIGPYAYISEDKYLSGEVAPPSTRAFYRSDYRRMAKVIQRMRHVKGDRYTPKPSAQMDEVGALAVTITAIFEADAPDAFDVVKFLASTQLPVKPEGNEPWPTQEYDDETYTLNHPEDAE